MKDGRTQQRKIRTHHYIHGLLICIATASHTAHSLTVAVFGGSGFIGRRVCRTLVQSDKCDAVISISKSGKPPSYYCSDVDVNNKDGTRWSDVVQWKSFDLDKDWKGDNGDKHEQIMEQQLELPPIDAAISCIGNVQPRREWKQLFGLSFDDERLFYENGILNQRAINLAKRAGAKRFAFVSVGYETAKCLEGPIEGYIYGKRAAESSAVNAFGEERTVFVGPSSFVFGGKRFPAFGGVYRALVESAPARAYVAGNDFLRNLSVAPLEDWLEKMVFSSPVEVDRVARVLCAGCLGLVDRDRVGPRRQGFYDQEGKAVVYPDALCVDGTFEIEQVDDLVYPSLGIQRKLSATAAAATEPVDLKEGGEPPFEGALIGKRPYLYPFPVIVLFATIFWSIATQQFVQVSPQ
mmetsp:Transcript_24721/g.40259  ORF Transcript_24721/g.40259 Transcript_24721/m.40259 type:complete len:407 (-) Transcript_24721:244-1464(-)|eukprot:CAMPEP_0196146418 /NCGR_PEP_ID=MMETSP0910-20130528/22976_1 /TAXON_ID=49265 /ORGANISM="Thalassiosira rotula, Strain GSO102" /LENGTH=406 /DNA_ID=CAMNT_0041408607 /DNA_START=394 /DNA_END=1614 /DNA_ORIENTATION=+